MSAIVSNVFGVQCDTQGQCLCYITVHCITGSRSNFYDCDSDLEALAGLGENTNIGHTLRYWTAQPAVPFASEAGGASVF